MTDPTTPVDPKNQADTAADDTTELAPVPAAEPAANTAADETPAAGKSTNATDPTGEKPGGADGPAGEKPGGASAGATGDNAGGADAGPAGRASAGVAGERGAGLGADAGPAGGGGTGVGAAKKKGVRRVRLSGAWLTVGGAVVLLVVLAVLGYVWGLGPLNRLNTNRGINPPAKLAGLDRITDKGIRDQLQLDQTRAALSRINNGKQATVEAYGSIDGSKMYVIIALRGKVDIDKTVADSGATPDKIKHVGSSTCVEASGNLPTQCYRGSNTLTVIAQSANEGVPVDQVAPVAEQAFKAMR
ncbi:MULTISPECIES: hypothetical protein [Kribbella]|uniref:Uncharacterized protein n=1 Tax=Kribbella karoonensis TaxID=324851 RepID=A0ABN2DNT6_9ACTN